LPGFLYDLTFRRGRWLPDLKVFLEVDLVEIDD
jgi:hypothetical protein